MEPEEGAVKSSADSSGQQEGGAEAQGGPADSQPSEWIVAIGDLCLYRRQEDDNCDLVKVVAFRRNEENGTVDFCVNFLGSMPPLEAWVDGTRLVPIKYMENYIMIEETCNIPGPSSIDQSSVLLQKQDELDESLKKPKVEFEEETSDLTITLQPLMSDIQGIVTCPVCNEILTDPMAQVCGHNICAACLGCIWSSQEKPVCPKCGIVLKERTTSINTGLASLIQRIADSRTQKSEETALCTLHAEKIKLFCKEDGNLACALCCHAHKEQWCTFLPVENAMHMYREKLTAAAPQVEAQLAELQMLHGEQVQKISQHKKKMSELKEHISNEFRKLYQFLHDKEQSWLEQLSGEGEIILREMEENLDRLGGDLHRYQETLHTLHSKLQQQDAMFFLKDIKSFAEKCCGEGREISPVNNALVLKDLSNGVYKGPIQYTVWKEMKSVINPGLTCMKLDPDTAHPNIFISEARTSARYTISARHIPKSAKRLSHHLAVLGQEGLSTGRHYWEVVNGDIPACDIGLVKESIYRMSLFPLCPMDGCWIFSLRNENKFVTLDGGIQSLKLRTRPRRVGLYLDYEEGQLSFYNAEDMSHIYTFECPFSGKLYPYIGHSNLAKPEVPLKMFALQI